MKPFDTPSDVMALNGQVQVDGPDGVAFSFTPEAAAETARRLAASAEAARQQQAVRAPAHSG